jgi:hypothetical protein
MGSLGIKAAVDDAQALIDPARTFSTVTNAPAGGLNYTYSKYRIEISAQPTFNEGVDPAANNPPQTFDRSIGYSIADYNLENLYDYRDNPFSGCDFTGNSGCAKVAPFLAAVTPPYDYVPASDDDYQARLKDIALEIINDLHSPDILMVQEVENQDICTVTGNALTCGTTDNADGKPDVLQELALKIAANGGPAYDAAFDRDSSDLRGIAPSFLYRTDRVELLPAAGDPILGSSPTIVYAGAPVSYTSNISNPKTLNAVLPSGVTACETSWVFPRAPDVALFRIYSTGIDVGSHRDVYVINNHFKSGPDTCVGHRTEQAKYNAALVAYIQAANPNARIVVGGDLNVYPRPDDIAYGASDQLGSLYDSSLGLKNLWEVLADQAPKAAYSYVYLGMAQTLDQMFINQAMLTDLQQFRIAHINSDFPADYTEDVARGTSDHDPNVATFVINDAPTVDAGGPYTVNEGSSVTLTAAGTDPEGQPLTYTWDLDNNGTFETLGQSVSFAGVDGPANPTVKVQVTDTGGLTAVASATVTVNNVAPTIVAVTNNGPINEGSSAAIAVNASDPAGANDPLTLEFDCNNDQTFETTTGTCAFTDNGSFTVNVRVSDGDGGVTTGSTVVIVNNVPPTATFVAPTPVNEGGTFTLALNNPVDPSSADTTVGFTYAFDCGAGYGAASNTNTATCPAPDNPNRTVKGKIADKDGGSTEYQATVTINNVAPVVGSINAPAGPVQANTSVNVSAVFSDVGTLDTHTATWNWGDGKTSAGTVAETNGSGTASGSHTFTAAGLYTLKLTVTDKDGSSAQSEFRYVAVYNPNAGAVIGAGWINSPAGAYTGALTWKGKATFGFAAQYLRNASTPTGLALFSLQSGSLNFSSTAYQWLVVNGSQAALQGTGKVNGAGNYAFLMSMIDNRTGDKFRIKIWDKATNNVIYDNQMGAPDDASATQTIGGGSILIYK